MYFYVNAHWKQDLPTSWKRRQMIHLLAEVGVDQCTLSSQVKYSTLSGIPDYHCSQSKQAKMNEELQTIETYDYF